MASLLQQPAKSLSHKPAEQCIPYSTLLMPGSACHGKRSMLCLRARHDMHYLACTLLQAVPQSQEH